MKLLKTKDKPKYETAKMEVLAINDQKSLVNYSEEYIKKIKGYINLGINNERVKSFKNKILNEVEENTQEVLFPFKLIKQEEFFNICKKHKLCITALNFYNKDIPNHVFDSIELFGNVLKQNDRIIDNRFKFYSSNKKIINDVNNVNINLSTLLLKDKSEIFKIAAYYSHFKFTKEDKKRMLKQGIEVGIDDSYMKVPVKFKLPKIQLDPLIFVPCLLKNEKYIIYIDGWDKESNDDDLRLRI